MFKKRRVELPAAQEQAAPPACQQPLGASSLLLRGLHARELGLVQPAALARRQQLRLFSGFAVQVGAVGAGGCRMRLARAARQQLGTRRRHARCSASASARGGTRQHQRCLQTP